MNNLMYPLYIDPGTGSMLFSVLIGLVATLYFVLKAAIIKFKFFITGKKQAEMQANEYSPYVIYCEGKQYISVFKPILDEFEKRKIKVVYYTSIEDDIAFESKYEYVQVQFIGEGNAAFFKLNMLTADVCLMTTPGLNVYQLKRSKGVKHYAHILHAASDATMYRLFGIDYFDSVLLTGDYQKKDIRLLEQQRSLPEKELITVGCTYLDNLRQKLDTIPVEKTVNAKKHKFTVLVSPSWGENAILSKYGTKLLSALVNTGFNIIVRPHPQSKKSENTMLENLIQEFTENELFHWNFDTDNIYSMAQSDIMISDFSGIIFDFTFLCNKPFIYINSNFDLRPYDADDLMELNPPISPWQFEIITKIGHEFNDSDIINIKDVLFSLSDSNEFYI